MPDTKIVLDRVPEQLLYRYLDIMKLMNRRDCLPPCMYTELNCMRAKIHDEILRAAKTTREDNSFDLALALYAEEMLAELEAA